MKVDTLSYGEKPYSVFSQMRTLVKDKGMPLEDAIREIESKLPIYARLSEELVRMLREEC